MTNARNTDEEWHQKKRDPSLTSPRSLIAQGIWLPKVLGMPAMAGKVSDKMNHSKTFASDLNWQTRLNDTNKSKRGHWLVIHRMREKINFRTFFVQALEIPHAVQTSQVGLCIVIMSLEFRLRPIESLNIKQRDCSIVMGPDSTNLFPLPRTTTGGLDLHSLIVCARK